jgi:RNA polymerase sigma-70 factor (ECF subfamily)
VIRELPRSALGVADESAVVALAIAGDDQAFSELVRRRQGSIRNLLRRLCREPALADDLSQATFLQAWRSLANLQAPGAFGGWLRRIAVNVWLQHARKPSREVQLDVAALSAASETGSIDGLASGVSRLSYEASVAEKLDLDRALTLLPQDVRLCIVLAYSERMSHSEISEASGFPLGTVKSHIARGSARLREILNAYGSTA